MSSIKVAVRCRPLFEQERPATGLDIQGRRILLDSKTYDPDYTFPPASDQNDLFGACKPILQCVKDGLNGTLMVYGQTGTGKTYTMLGTDGEDDGLVHKVIAHMLDHVQHETLDGAQCALTLSMIEIYNERLTDMLSENGDEEVTLIAGFPRAATKITLARLADANEAVKKGLAYRHTAVTMMNERSSRSHVVFIVDLEKFNAYTDETDVAHLFMVDLAGSESIKKSQASGTTAGEAGKINKSLLALKSVFLALSNTNEATRPPHVPYRDSRLTELLQDSIGGTARTLMIACISSVGRDIEETKSTLMYAVKARSIKNATNSEKEKLLIRLRSMEGENQRLRNRLQERVNERGGYYVTKEEHERYEVMEAESKELRESVEQLVKVTQANDARKHISESQTKLLQAMIADKEEELQAFKGLYSEALQRFERNAATLQKVVQTAVAGVKDAAQSTAAQQHQQLAAWRSRLLGLLEAHPQDTLVELPALTLEPTNERSSVSAALSGRHTPPLAPRFTQGGPSTTTSPQKGRGGRGSLMPASAHGSPGRRGTGVGVTGTTATTRTNSTNQRWQQQQQQHQHQRDRDGTVPPSSVFVGRAPNEEEHCTGASPLLPLTMAPDDTLISPTATAVCSPVMLSQASATVAALPSLTFLAEADNACLRIVERVNRSFVTLIDETTTAYTRCAEAEKVAATAREAATDAACRTLRESVEQCIRTIHKASRRAAEESTGAQEELQSRLRVLGASCGITSEKSDKTPIQFTNSSHSGVGAGLVKGPCEARPLQHVVRDACRAAVQSAESVLPSPAAPEEVCSRLDSVVASYQSRLGTMYAVGLQPLASFAGQPEASEAQLRACGQQQAQSQAAAEALGAEGVAPCHGSSATMMITTTTTSPASDVTVAPIRAEGVTSVPSLSQPSLPPSSALPPQPSGDRVSAVRGCSSSYAWAESALNAQPCSPPSSSASTLAASSPAGPPLPPRPVHTRTPSLTGTSATPRGQTAARGSRTTTCTRSSTVGRGGGPVSARSSLRMQPPNTGNVSPRPAKKRTRSSQPIAHGSRIQAGTSSPNATSGRRGTASRTEHR